MSDKNDSHPLVSIIVPVFNGERFLRESLDSILAQTYPRIEVLVMDDASTDGTPSILASYGDRIKVVRQPANRGIYSNMNDGIAEVAGDYVAIYHADDIYDPNIVEREAEFLDRHPEAGAVFCLDVFVDASGREFGRLVLPPEARGSRPLPFAAVFNALLKYKNHLFCCPTSMVRAAVYRDVGPYRASEFRNSADLEMWLRIGRKYPMGILEEYLMSYRRDPGCSAERYHHLRTDPHRYFRIMDLYLDEGDRALATPAALVAYEGHREEDRLMRVISHYILCQRHEASDLLKEIRAKRILASPQIQRGRLFVLFLALQLLTRMPRISPVATLFYRRWHARRSASSAVPRVASPTVATSR
jgi:glycosyltransferase involved in cell wall biosynthesis